MASQLKASDPVVAVRKRFAEPAVAAGLTEYAVLMLMLMLMLIADVDAPSAFACAVAAVVVCRFAAVHFLALTLSAGWACLQTSLLRRLARPLMRSARCWARD